MNVGYEHLNNSEVCWILFILLFHQVTRTDGDNVQLKFMKKNDDGHYLFSTEPEALHPKDDIVMVLQEPDMILIGRALVYKFEGLTMLHSEYVLH